MRLLILGTGGMANTHAENFAKIDGVEMVGAVDVDPARVSAFAEKHKIANTFGSLDEAIAWGKFEAVANVTPDRAHHPTTMQLVKAGKHQFCEKPLAENHALASEMADAAEAAGLINMVNLTYRNVAPLQKARDMVLAGEIGSVKHVEASYLQSWLISKQWGDWRTESQWLWRLSTAHGSNGVLGDIGIHILDFASYGAGLEIDHIFGRLKTFDKAEGGKIGDYSLDANDSFTMSVDFSNGALGVIHATRWAAGHFNDLKLRIYGDKGGIEVLHTLKGSWLKACTGAHAELAEWQEIDAGKVPTNYERFAAAVKTGRNGEPDFRHAANLQKALDLAFVTEKQRREAAL
ncbi:Gfo/Idh/MocA family oxidoreductase [Rhizobium sp. KVB221]|uniref:Gfo/Idh/MocA family oxidoreductase n=1 Tax=Rhizobium setariae TaxID=2801340 RepID=A0A936YTE4_9HYPH|nr:Gfo/Idh/MocA family oxidoreductase [Rhizobium setariae]MBL0374546.1 Gfo/Idh/MocA family oxidoreductase [Rhizobium setariae]